MGPLFQGSHNFLDSMAAAVLIHDSVAVVETELVQKFVPGFVSW